MKKFLYTVLLLVVSNNLFSYYSPEQGRWTSRDPIEEKGGENLYGLAKNDSINKVDNLGLKAFLLIYDIADKTDMFKQWKDTVERKIKNGGLSIFANKFSYDKQCDEIVEVEATSHSVIESAIKNTKDIAYIGSFGHGNGGSIWYDVPSVAYGVEGYVKGSKSTVLKKLNAWKTSNLTEDAFVELYHCYTRELSEYSKTVAGTLQGILGVPVYGTKKGINNGYRWNTGFPRFVDGDSADKNPNYPGNHGNPPTEK